VATGEEERSARGSSDSGGGSEALLTEGELDVPLAPDLGCCSPSLAG
jgi:hypothetical protein